VVWLLMETPEIELRQFPTRASVRVLVDAVPVVSDDEGIYHPTNCEPYKYATKWNFPTGPVEAVLIWKQDGSTWIKLHWRF